MCDGVLTYVGPPSILVVVIVETEVRADEPATNPEGAGGDNTNA